MRGNMLTQLFELNKQLFLALNQLGDIGIIRSIVSVFADAPIFIVPLFLMSFWLYYTQKKDTSGKERLLYIFYATILAVVFNIIIQKFIHIDRPAEFAKSAGHFLLNHIPDASFPSDHASVWVAFITALFLFGYETIGYVTIPFFTVMLVSRVIWGVHWPLDILGGTAVGIVSGFVIASIQENRYIKKLNGFVMSTAQYLKL